MSIGPHKAFSRANFCNWSSKNFHHAPPPQSPSPARKRRRCLLFAFWCKKARFLFVRLRASFAKPTSFSPGVRLSNKKEIPLCPAGCCAVVVGGCGDCGIFATPSPPPKKITALMFSALSWLNIFTLMPHHLFNPQIIGRMQLRSDHASRSQGFALPLIRWNALVFAVERCRLKSRYLR